MGAGERPARRRAEPRLRQPPTVRHQTVVFSGDHASADLGELDVELHVVECDLPTESARQVLARDDGPLGELRSWRALLCGTGPARAGGAKCNVEADTTREPHHLRSARSLVAVPVERDDPPAAVAAASLVPRRRRGGPASAHGARSRRAPPRGRLSLSRSRGRRVPARRRCPVTMIGQPRHSSTSAALHPPSLTRGISRVAELSVRRTTEGDQIRTQDPAPGGELAGMGGSLAVFDSARRDAHHQNVMPSGGDRPLRPGDIVEVRPAAEILATLDADGTLDDMLFMPEMRQYVGRRFTVSRRVEKICDTIAATGSRRVYDTVYLEDLRCDGSGHGGCQAGCRIYWKEAWLRRVDGRCCRESPRRRQRGRARATGAGEHSDRA